MPDRARPATSALVVSEVYAAVDSLWAISQASSSTAAVAPSGTTRAAVWPTGLSAAAEGVGGTLGEATGAGVDDPHAATRRPMTSHARAAEGEEMKPTEPNFPAERT